ncbi:unnamed protein product [Moneuplotes crassus]|uniref:Uncharacterized protein n=1 Tax=Euplotes crassus TaxID=5936 RepID=A0AAD1U4J8_EUPCR|nr:unnamed protein product [Moneuplotes crassus]
MTKDNRMDTLTTPASLPSLPSPPHKPTSCKQLTILPLENSKTKPHSPLKPLKTSQKEALSQIRLETKSVPASNLLMKRKKMKLAMLKVNTEKNEALNPFQAINDMKNLSCEMSPRSAKTESSQATEGNLSYLFVKPKSSLMSSKEGLLNEFLTQQGVFQINLPIALNDYKFECQ